MKRPPFWIACLVSLGTVTLFMFRVTAEPAETRARFDNDMIVLPLVLSGDAEYRMELQRKVQRSRAPGPDEDMQALDGAEFRVVQSTKTATSRAVTPAVLKHNVLRIPVVQWGTHDYRMELRGDGQQSKVTSVSALNAAPG